ncbi:unnamed protein product [Closterium sp. NIES-54]
MASLRVLAFDHEGRLIQFDTWLDDLQLYLLSDTQDSVSLFDLVSSTAPAPPATADSATRSQWLTRDATTRLAIRNHLPLPECAHFGQHRTAQALYDAVVARYSSPAIAALGRLLLPYLFPDLSAFATVEDLVSHLRTSDARYRAAAPAEFLDKNQPQIFITLYFVVTRPPDSLRSVRDHFLSLDPTDLTIDLLEQHLLAAETSVVAVHVGAASASAKRRSGKGKGGRSGGGGSGSGSGGSGGMVEAVEVMAAVGVVTGVGALVAAVEAAVGVAIVAMVGVEADGLELGVEALEEARGSSSSFRARPSRPSNFVSGCFSVGRLGRRCFSRLTDDWSTEFGDEVERPRWADLFRAGVAIFDLDFDVLLASMYALSTSAYGDCYRCVPPDPGIVAAALGPSESVLPGTAHAKALHTFTLDSGASRCFICDSTTLTPLSAPVPVRLADPSGSPVVARASTVLPCPVIPSGSLTGLHLPSFSTNLVSTAALQDAMVTTTTPGGQRVLICTCARTGRHLATFTRRPGSSLYTLATEPTQVAASAQVSASDQVSASPPALAYSALPSLRRGAAARCSSLIFVSLDDFSPADSPHGRGGAEPGGEEPGGAEPAGVEPGGAEPKGVERGGAESEGAEFGGAEPQGAASSGGPAGASPRQSPLELREWLVRRARLRSGATRAGGAGAAGAGGAGVTAGAGGTGGAAAAGSGCARTRGTGAARTGGVGGAGTGDPTEHGVAGAGSSGAGGTRAGGPGGTSAGGTGAGGAGTGGTNAGGAGVGGTGMGGAGAGGVGGAGAVDPGGTVRSRPYCVPLLQQPTSPLPAPSPYTEQSGGLTEHREPASCHVLPIRTARRVPRSRPPPVPGTTAMALRPSSVPLCVPLPAPS